MLKDEVLINSPTRIDLAGGTLDCWPINALMSPVTTVNVAISLFTSCGLSPRDDGQICIYSRETQQTYEFSNLEECLNCDREDFRFFREHINYWKPSFGFNLSAQSDSPMGGGLGGSSSLSISIFKAFCQLNRLEIDDDRMVRVCSGIEAKILKMPTGTQDYFPALKGGVNIIDYKWGWPEVKRLSPKTLGMKENISLFFTGKSHHSGINNWEVIKKFVEGDPATHKALEKIQSLAQRTKEVVLAANWEELPPIFREEFKARVELTPHFSSPEIETLAKIALANGGEAINICGAGGGGCVFVWSQPENRSSVIQACSQAGFKFLDVEWV